MALRPGLKKYDWEVELQDTRSLRKYGLKVPQGSMQIGVISQDDTVYIRNVGKRVGDFDEQRSWKGGRGVENYSDSAEGFWDSQNCWTLTPGHVHQGLQWFHARGLRNEEVYMPTRNSGSVNFQPLLGATLHVANSFAASGTYSMAKGYLWLRRKGTPGTVTIRFRIDNAGDPGTSQRSISLTTADVTDYVSLYQKFDLDPVFAATSGVTYWVSIEGDSNDDKDNHWEVAVNPNDTGGKYSNDGTNWTNSTNFAMYYRVTDADVSKKWFGLTFQDAFYIVSQHDDGTTASKLYINGDRGKASSATTTSITDTTKTWVADRYLNARVKIVAGTGKGQTRKIITNSTQTLTVDRVWKTTPDATSQYIIYSTEWFTQVTFSGGTPTLGYVTGKPVLANNVVYFPQGTAAGIIHMQWNTGTAAHDGFAETPSGTTVGCADLLFLGSDQTSGAPVMWRANNTTGTGSGGAGTVSVAPLTAAGAYIAWNTAPTFAASIFTGYKNYDITGFAGETSEKGALTVYVFRQDGLGRIASNVYINTDSGIEKTPDKANGVLAISHKQFIYYSWLHSLVRIFNTEHTDIGQDFRGVGLPDGREGVYADADTYLSNLFLGVDAGEDGTSSVQVWDGLAFHEFVRGRTAGERIRMVKVQPCPDTRAIVWSNMGDDLVWQEMPLKKASPRLDSGIHYQHEAVLESTSIDMGTASGLPKYINELYLSVKNLNIQGREIHIDYQFDDDVHTNNWTYAGTVSKSPESVQFLGLENVRRFAYRLRIYCNDNTIPIDIEGIVPSGYARTPFKMVFTMKIQAGGIFSRRGKSVSSGELVRWLLDASKQPGRVKMTSVYELAHNWNV
ncbi:MAG TPA: hypothetical protein VIY48_14735, partial [Candidatus Paceibacterota bacterium]